MSKARKKPTNIYYNEKVLTPRSENPNSEGTVININIYYNINIEDNRINIQQRAEGGGQILRNVGMNANQGGQNASNRSSTSNNQSNFANGNGRSGIAGNNNDEAGGQQGIKVRDSVLLNSIIKSISEQGGGK
ncbi:hypothetical protein SAMN05877753_104414 [Bacillus oleivorans]|uniref:Uncharacterized protein n=1 Tax=Bacillus oleivorans TaxID=1448271 RepID=A0A285CTM8_9BACI|nr:hypothetical protein [Bacillus oleivorans]SNX70882.1 hypothetical protein SAMN05877753_104414 [Bacillus oleivorans]